MPRKSLETVLREVRERLAVILAENRRAESTIMRLLTAVFLTGLALLGAGVALDRWPLLIPGSAAWALLGWPIKQLMALRWENVQLQVLPELLRLVEEDEARRLAGKLADRFIDRMGQS